jgi:hypothetical protein
MAPQGPPAHTQPQRRARLRLVTPRTPRRVSPRLPPLLRPPRLHARPHPATSSPLLIALPITLSPSRQRLPVCTLPAALLCSTPMVPDELRRPRLTAPPASTPPRARPRAPTAPPARPTTLDLHFVAKSLLVTTALSVHLLPFLLVIPQPEYASAEVWIIQRLQRNGTIFQFLLSCLVSPKMLPHGRT